jgi:hypothetical protein
VRIVAVGGMLVAHAATCPHWGGPLAAAPRIGIEEHGVVLPGAGATDGEFTNSLAIV